MSKRLKSHRTPERRIQLINAAIDVIAEHGLEAATTRKVAERAALPLSSVHYAFSDKDELICAVMDFVGDQMEALQRDAQLSWAEDQPDPESALRSAIRVLWNLVEADPSFQLMQFELMIYCLRNPGSHWLAQRQYERNCDLVAQILRSALGGAEVPYNDIEESARCVLAALDGLILHFIIHQNREHARAGLCNLTDALVPLLLKEPGTQGSAADAR